MEAADQPNAIEAWQAWFDMTPEIWKNVAGVAADYFEDYISFASSLQYTNQEYLKQLELPFLIQQQALTSSEKPVRLAPLPCPRSHWGRDHSQRRSDRRPRGQTNCDLAHPCCWCWIGFWINGEGDTLVQWCVAIIGLRNQKQGLLLSE
jgi:hypothetical protein